VQNLGTKFFFKNVSRENMSQGWIDRFPFSHFFWC